MPVAHKVVNKRLANLIAEHGTTIIKTATVIPPDRSPAKSLIPNPTVMLSEAKHLSGCVDQGRAGVQNHTVARATPQRLLGSSIVAPAP